MSDVKSQFVLAVHLGIYLNIGQDFPDGPVAKNPCPHAGAWVWSLVRKLDSTCKSSYAMTKSSHMLQIRPGTAKINKH